MAVAFALVIVASAGSMFIQIETDPVELWSSRNSRSRVEKDFFETAFQPFFRVQQVILKPKFNQSFLYKNLFDEEILVGSAFQPEFMLKTLSLLKAIQGITAGDGTTLADVCHKPLSPDSQECNIQSIWAYWQDDPFKFNLHGINPDTQHNDTYLDHFLLCARNPTLQEDQTAMKLGCMSKGGVPVQPVYVLGGFDSTKEPNGHGAEEFTNPTALIITILLNNNRNDTSQAMAWEKEFVDFMLAKIEEESDFVDITFNSERSIQDELERSSLGDLGVILISYSTMLVYIMISLGKVYSWRTLFVDIKVTLSLIGTIGVLLAISSAIGMLGFIGVPTTLVIFQILPFLILAVGVDNIFILVNTAQLIKEDTQKDVIEVVGLTLSRVGPSMLMSTVAQVTAFCLGSISDMPAVRSFSLYAAVSLAWNFLLQMSIFIGALCLDLKRQHAQRADVFCCLQRNPREPLAISDSEGLFQRFWSTLYVPFLFAPIVRTLVVVLFAAWTCASVWLIPQIRIGLEQEIAMPDDSHVLKYLNALKTDLSVGPPLYFVVNRTRSDSPFNFALGESQNKVCGGRGCNSDGLQAQIKLWSRRPQLTRLATPAQSWIDDFFSWAQYCCKHDGTGQTCTGTSDSGNEYGDYGIYGDYGSYGDYDPTEASRCEPCVSQGDRPSSDLFGLLVTRFLAQNPDANCPKAGKAAYRHALNLRALPNESVEVDASSFFAFHTVLRDSNDFTEALRWSRRLADNLTSMLNTPQDQGVAVFAYSIFYVFYEQYLTMWTDTCWSLSLAIGAVFLVILVMTGLDLFSAVAIIVTILLTLINLGGLMVVLGIGLNAISLVNMIMTVGVGVEFSSHLVQAFRIHAAPTGIERSRAALIEWGPTLFSGVHLTNAIGVVILALSKSQIFHVYFFQMYMSIVLLGMLHGMVLLPVILSFWGPEPQGKP
ncbi:NPC intracellular cholesterol transporter 1-like [Tigriopus californicus]|nr:NPC intracellular cholesterol transporter 1-like [Tigriopus californicus]